MKSLKCIIFCTIAIILFNPLTGLTQEGTLDLTFGNEGRAVFDVNGKGYGKISDVIIQNDDKIVSLGVEADSGQTLARMSLRRFKSNGTLDSTFNATGKLILLEDIKAIDTRRVFLQSDNKILAVARFFTGNPGEHTLFIARVNPDGSFDKTYGTNGITTQLLEPAFGFEEVQFHLQADNKLLVYYAISNSNFSHQKSIVARISDTGKLDETFSDKGKLLVDSIKYVRIFGIASQLSDKFIIGRYIADSLNNFSLEVLRFSNTGVLDTLFATKGKFKREIKDFVEPAFLKVHTDGKIYIIQNGNYLVNTFPVTRLNANGTLDASYGNNGDAKISGAILDFASVTPYSATLDKNGKCIAGGIATSTDNTRVQSFIIRFTELGLPDTKFGVNGFLELKTDNRFHFLQTIALQNDGKIITGGWLQPDFLRNVSLDLMRINSSFYTKLNESYENVPFTIFPNPTNAYLHIDDNNLGIGKTIEVYNGLGNLVSTTTQNIINVQNLPNGVYYVKLSYKNKIGVRQFVVQH